MKYTMTPNTMAIGCAGSLITVGGFVAGVYHGLADSKGISFDAGTEYTLNYGPMALSSLFGFIGGKSIVEKEDSLEEMVQNVPIERRDKAKESAKGCFPLSSAIINPIIVGCITYGGYALGSWLGKQF
jgi:hypothetical protein